MKLYLSGLIGCAALLAQYTGQSQEKDTTTDHPHAKSYMEATFHYINDNVYLGRKDSLTIPYATASIGYYHSSGLYISSSVSYTSVEGNGHIDLFTLEGGYDFSAVNFDGGISAAKYFYNSQSANVQSEMKGSLSAYAGYDLNFIRPVIEASVGFSTSTDYSAGIGLEHTFTLLKDRMEITPGITANGSTQNYYDGYYSKRRYNTKKRKQRTGVSYYDITANVDDASKFKLLDYEWSVPIKYTLHSFSFKFAPVLAIPVNPAHVTYTIKSSSGGSTSSVSTEKLTGSHFFFEAAIAFRF